MMKIRSLFVTILAILVLAVTVATAAAHADLIEAQPAPGAVLTESPAEIRLTFSEPAGVESEILLFGEGFRAVNGIEAQMDSAHPEVVLATLPPLESDVYTVQWSVVSEDGHEISGTYSFAVVGETAASSDMANDDHSSDMESIGSTVWSMAAIGLIGGALLLLLAQRLLRGQ